MIILSLNIVFHLEINAYILSLILILNQHMRWGKYNIICRKPINVEN